MFYSSVKKNTCSAKLHIKSVYSIIPIHWDDQMLLGIRWNDMIYQALPFDLRSAPTNFTAVADGLAWAITCAPRYNSGHSLPLMISSLPRERSAQVCVSNSVMSVFQFSRHHGKSWGVCEPLAGHRKTRLSLASQTLNPHSVSVNLPPSNWRLCDTHLQPVAKTPVCV